MTSYYQIEWTDPVSGVKFKRKFPFQRSYKTARDQARQLIDSLKGRGITAEAYKFSMEPAKI